MGCPTTSWIVDDAEQINAPGQDNRQITVTDIPKKLDTSCGFAYSIIHEDLGYHNIFARWVPEQLTDEHKWACVKMCV